MKNSRFLTIGLLTLALSGAGTNVALAQTSGNDAETAAPQTRAERVEAPSDRSAKRREYNHKGRRGNRTFWGRGGSEIFRTLFNEIDADGDGAVTQEEVDAYRATKVGEADTSGDGALSIEEFDTLYREFTRSRMVDAFQKLDANGDGVIDADELDTRFRDIVERMDRDGDGALTLQHRR
ncbi:EF-hand domain-containing protein [Primorskyibacter marinus]|uniref:EF-hand domain-containing protein n=1 Tax=Primorskyibacter marinus TaxID=1977320 RepID=UPI0018E56F05|nr:EF-hand domain-containing protein [Primorskyibacter marinus]